MGRDLWTRTWKGAQISLFIGVVAAMLDIFYWRCIWCNFWILGGHIEDTNYATYLEVIAYSEFNCRNLFVLIFEASIWTIILAMSITGWLGMSRVVRGEFLKLKNQEFVMASKHWGLQNSN